jgi:hypothetical protein
MILWYYPEEGGDIKQIIVGSMNIDTLSVKSKIKDKDRKEHWLNKQKNGTVMIQVFHT